MDTKILIADGQNLMRIGLRLIIESQVDFIVVGEVERGKDLQRAIVNYSPDIVITELILPDIEGIEVIHEIKDIGYKGKIVILTSSNDDFILHSAIKARVDGYVLKGANEVTLLTALRLVIEGNRFIDPLLAGHLAQKVFQLPKQKVEGQHLLSNREIEVVRLLTLGYSNDQIAKALIISVKTVETHRANIRSKLNLATRAEIVKYALANNLINISGLTGGDTSGLNP